MTTTLVPQIYRAIIEQLSWENGLGEGLLIYGRNCFQLQELPPACGFGFGAEIIAVLRHDGWGYQPPLIMVEEERR
jgi:hypothetical protein